MTCHGHSSTSLYAVDEEVALYHILMISSESLRAGLHDPRTKVVDSAIFIRIGFKSQSGCGRCAVLMVDKVLSGTVRHNSSISLQGCTGAAL